MSAKKTARPRSRALTPDRSPLPPAPAQHSVAIANHHPRLRLDRRAITRALHLLDSEFPKSKIENRKLVRRSLGEGGSKIPAAPAGELSLVFLTDTALAQLHADFLADPTPTDVITFAGDPALGTAGEICVSVDAAIRHLAPRRRSTLRSPLSALSSFSNELTLYLVHGWLHLAGYDDLKPEKKRVMRRAEARALRLLARAGALPKFTLRAAPT